MPAALIDRSRAWLLCAVLVAFSVGCSATARSREATTTPELPTATTTATADVRPTASPTEVRPTAESTPAVIAPRCPDPYASTGVADPSPIIEGDTVAPVRIRHSAVAPAAELGQPMLNLRIDSGLDQLVRERLGDDAPHYAVVAEDLRDGRGVAINGDQVFYAASLFKLEVMYEAFRQRAIGALDFGEQYVVTDYYAGFNLGPHLVEQCDRASVTDLLRAMMSVSDNSAAVMLQDRVGAGNINATMAALGMNETRLTEDGTLPATAADLARLVSAIAMHSGVSATDSQQMLALMASESLADRIPAELPAGTFVAHKTGNWENATHDAGLVIGRNGSYVIVLMSDIGYAGDASRAEADVAKLIYDDFEKP